MPLCCLFLSRVEILRIRRLYLLVGRQIRCILMADSWVDIIIPSCVIFCHKLQLLCDRLGEYG